MGSACKVCLSIRPAIHGHFFVLAVTNTLSNIFMMLQLRRTGQGDYVSARMITLTSILFELSPSVLFELSSFNAFLGKF